MTGERLSHRQIVGVITAGIIASALLAFGGVVGLIAVLLHLAGEL